MPGTACVDAPISGEQGQGWLLPQLGGEFTALLFGTPDADTLAALQRLQQGTLPLRLVVVSADAMSAASPGISVWHDAEGLAAQRYDARPGTVYLIRPDQHVCARWRQVDIAGIQQAMSRATGNAQDTHTGAPAAKAAAPMPA